MGHKSSGNRAAFNTVIIWFSVGGKAAAPPHHEAKQTTNKQKITSVATGERYDNTRRHFWIETKKVSQQKRLRHEPKEAVKGHLRCGTQSVNVENFFKIRRILILWTLLIWASLKLVYVDCLWKTLVVSERWLTRASQSVEADISPNCQNQLPPILPPKGHAWKTPSWATGVTSQAPHPLSSTGDLQTRPPPPPPPLSLLTHVLYKRLRYWLMSANVDGITRFFFFFGKRPGATQTLPDCSARLP